MGHIWAVGHMEFISVKLTMGMIHMRHISAVGHIDFRSDNSNWVDWGRGGGMADRIGWIEGTAGPSGSIGLKEAT